MAPVASFLAGFGTLRVSALLQNYLLLAFAMLLLLVGVALLFRPVRPSESTPETNARAARSTRAPSSDL